MDVTCNIAASCASICPPGPAPAPCYNRTRAPISYLDAEKTQETVFREPGVLEEEPANARPPDAILERLLVLDVHLVLEQRGVAEDLQRARQNGEVADEVEGIHVEHERLLELPRLDRRRRPDPLVKGLQPRAGPADALKEFLGRQALHEAAPHDGTLARCHSDEALVVDQTSHLKIALHVHVQHNRTCRERYLCC